MLRKNIVLIAVVISAILLFIATLQYPGGSQSDASSNGFNWQHNYFSNLFSTQAVNGMENAARPWAIASMLFMSAAFGLFFIRFSKKVPKKSGSKVIKYSGAGSMLFAFLAVTPLHDEMIIASSTLALICFFYITVLALKSKLTSLKIYSIFCMLIFYGTSYVYFTQSHLEYLPILQKIGLLANIIWILALDYFTTSENFEITKK